MSLDWNDLHRVAETVNVSELPKKKEQAAAVLERAMVEPDRFSKLWDSLSAMDRRVFAAALFEMRSDGYLTGVSKLRFMQAIQRSYDFPAAAMDDSLQRLLQCGLLVPTQIWYLGDGVEVPELLLPLVYEEVYAQGGWGGDSATSAEASSEVAASRMFARDLTRFAAYLSKRPVALTQAGVIYKRDLVKLRPLFRTLDLARNVTPLSPWEDIPFSIYLAIRVMEMLGVVVPGSAGLEVNGIRLTEFLQAPDEGTRGQIAQAVMEQFGRHRPHLWQMFIRWTLRAEIGVWHALPQTVAAYAGVALNGQTPEWLRDLHLFFEIMALTGAVEIGRTAVGTLVVRLAFPPRESAERFVVQPNLELLLPEEAPALLHFIAGQFAELQRADEMSIYRLTKSSILQLCDRGWTASDIERALAESSRSAIPGAVTRTLRDWIESYERAVIWDALVVKFGSTTTYSAFMQDKRAQKAVVESLGDAAVLVRRGAERIVRQILDDIGAPAPEAVRMPSEDAVAASHGMRRKRAVSKRSDVALARLTGPDLLNVAVGEMRSGN